MVKKLDILTRNSDELIIFRYLRNKFRNII